MTAFRQGRPVVASGYSLREAFVQAGVPQTLAAHEADEIRVALSSRGYGLPSFTVRGPRLVVAATFKVIDGQVVRAEAAGFDQRDAERRLVSMVTRK